jgi:Ca2+-binding EF-hand superfamily protein
MDTHTVEPPREVGDVARLREDFDYYDRNDDGLMEYEEFVRFLQAIDGQMSESECVIGFQEVDTDRDGVVEFEEFLAWWGAP